MTGNGVDDVLEALAAMFDPHKDHQWIEVPPCVYCESCGVRLYQGKLPADRRGEGRDG